MRVEPNVEFESVRHAVALDVEPPPDDLENAVTTYYVGGYYEMSVDGETVTERKYYTAGSTTIAMRTIVGETDTLNWLLSDHLGSTSVTADESGVYYSELRYSSYGEVRYSDNTTPTDRRYTGQRVESELGLYYYHARWYDPYLNHFNQPDTLISDYYNPQDWNRYTYTRFNPVKYTDSTGHYISEEDSLNDGYSYNNDPYSGPSYVPHVLQLKKQAFLSFIENQRPDVYNPRYNTPGRVDGVITNYHQVSSTLFNLYGNKYIDSSGKIDDTAFMSITGYAEFGTQQGAVYNEAIEALSNQYYGNIFKETGPMQCSGHCTLEDQLLWATQMEAWYNNDHLEDLLPNIDLAGPSSIGAQAQNKFFSGIDSSWFWGNVTEAEMANYNVVASVMNNAYPGKPYFIVYSGQR
jgi:RHS repeat-associated protein